MVTSTEIKMALGNLKTAIRSANKDFNRIIQSLTEINKLNGSKLDDEISMRGRYVMDAVRDSERLIKEYLGLETTTGNIENLMSQVTLKD